MADRPPPQVGQEGTDSETGRKVRFDGTDWIYVDTPASPPAQHSVGGFLSNAAADVVPTIADAVVGGAKLVGALNPVSLPGTLRSATAAAPDVIRGLWKAGSEAVANPGETLGNIGQAIYDRPVMAASMLSPVARVAGLGRVATAMDAPALMAKAGGGLAKAGGKRWMGGVAKVSSALKKENQGINIPEVMAREGISPTTAGADKASRMIKDLQSQTQRMRDSSSRLIERTGPEGALVPPETPPPASPLLPPETPPIARAPRPAPGTEELRAAIERIDPAADTNNAKRLAYQKELDWYESQVPNPVQASRIGNIKGQVQDQVSYGVRAKELSDETRGKKKLAVGLRRVESEAFPEMAPINKRIGELVAAEEAAAARAEAAQNLDVVPARVLWGGSLGGGALGGYFGGATGGIQGAALGAAIPYALGNPTIGGAGASAMYRGGRALGSLGDVPSALGISAESLRREAEASLLANGSTEKP